MRFRPLSVVAIGATLLLAGCATEPPSDNDPSPTPPVMSKEDAVEAAEETYRAFVDAQNAVDLSDPGTFEPMFDLLTDEQLSGARESFSQMHADGWDSTGAAIVRVVTLKEFDGENGSIRINVCLDVSDVSGIDAKGQTIVSPDRPDVQALKVSLVADASSSTGYLIDQISGRNGGPSCV